MLSTIIVTMSLVGAPEGRELIDRVVAVVNDDIVLSSELEQRVEALAGNNVSQEQALEQLINERLMSQQIRDAKITITDEEIDRAVKDILRTNNITEAELAAAIEARGMTMEKYRSDLKEQLIRLKLIDQKVRSRVVIPEAEIKAEYDRQTRDEQKEELVTIRHIFFRWGSSPDRTERDRIIGKARAARQRVSGGEDFATVAKEISQGPTATNGGDLGEMNREQMIPELAKGIEGLKAGEMSAPIETDSGVHIVLLEKVRAKASSSFAEVRNRIYQELYQREVEAQMGVWLEELRKQAAVAIKTLSCGCVRCLRWRSARPYGAQAGGSAR